MSLKVWLPLNGNLNNQGLSNTTVTNNGATIDNNGKIGKCYNFSNQYLSIPAPLNSSTTNFTICAWVYVSSLANSYGPIYNSRTSGSGGGIVLWMVSSGFRMDDGSEWDLSYSYPTNTWIHVCYTRDPFKKKLYLNGTLIGEANSGNLSGINTTAYIAKDLINPNSYYLNGKLNDVRIYDHCLSPKEVKELSKGLVLHYPLNDWQILRSRCSNITWNLLFRSIQGYQTSSFTQNNGVYTSISTTSSDLTGFMLSATLIPLHKYLITFDIKKNYETGSCVCRAWCSSKSFGDYLVQNISPILTEWTPTYVLYNASNLTVTDNNGSYYFWFRRADLQNCNGTETVWTRNINVFDLTLMFGSGNEPTYLEFNLMFPLQLKYERDEGTIKNLVLPIPDYSGYNNNGTVTGTLTLSDNTPRYDKCTLFGNGTKITPPIFPSFLTNEATVSMWVKLDQLPPSSPGRTMLYTAWYGFSCEITSSGQTYFRTYLTSGSVDSPLGTMTTGNWIHWVGVKSSTGILLYLNGTLIGTTTNSNNFNWSSNVNNSIACYSGSYYLYGKLSDLRLYATALSADDVKALYQEAAFIDHKGNIGCYLFYEDADSQITKTGQIRTEEFEEISDLSDGVAKVYELKIECNQLIEI